VAGSCCLSLTVSSEGAHMTETPPRKNALLVAAVFRRSRMRKRSGFSRRLRIGNYAMTGAVSNELSASVTFRKRSALLATSVTWLKPKVITPMSASAGVTRPSRCAPRRSRGCTRTILSWRARLIRSSMGWMALPVASEVRTVESWREQPQLFSRGAIMAKRLSNETLSDSAVIWSGGRKLRATPSRGAIGIGA